MDDIDRRLLNMIQGELPLVDRPFRELGERLGIGEMEVIGRIARLKQRSLVRQISAVFDTRGLGYQSTLVAMQVEPRRIQEAAAVVSSHPGVSHNYERDHMFNLWFTLALPPSSSIPRTVERLADMAGAKATLLLPALKLFKIGVQFDMVGDGDPTLENSHALGSISTLPTPVSLTSLDIAMIRELQEDVELEAHPFLRVAERIGVAEREVLTWMQLARKRGLLRRFAAVLNHRRAGFGANAMGVWVVPPEEVDRVGPVMASFRAVSHCYERPTYPAWPYNLFTMIHGRSAAECQQVASRISLATGIDRYALLYSTREFKKVRVKYYTPEIADWEVRYL